MKNEKVEVATDDVIFPEQQKPNLFSQIFFMANAESEEDRITKAIRAEILAKQREIIGKYLAQNEPNEQENIKSALATPQNFREYSKNEANKEKINKILQNPAYKTELEQTEIQGYSKIHREFEKDFSPMQWDGPTEQVGLDITTRTQSVRNPANNQEIAILTESTHKLQSPITIKDSQNQQVELKNYRTIDFPTELKDQAGPLHLSLAVKDQEGNNIAKKDAVYFTAHYNKEGLLTEVSSPTPIKFSSDKPDAACYIEHQGKIYTLPVTKEKYDQMMMVVEQNKGHNLNISQSQELVQDKARDQERNSEQQKHNEKPIVDPPIVSSPPPLINLTDKKIAPDINKKPSIASSPQSLNLADNIIKKPDVPNQQFSYEKFKVSLDKKNFVNVIQTSNLPPELKGKIFQELKDGVIKDRDSSYEQTGYDSKNVTTKYNKDLAIIIDGQGETNIQEPVRVNAEPAATNDKEQKIINTESMAASTKEASSTKMFNNPLDPNLSGRYQGNRWELKGTSNNNPELLDENGKLKAELERLKTELVLANKTIGQQGQEVVEKDKLLDARNSELVSTKTELDKVRKENNEQDKIIEDLKKQLELEKNKNIQREKELDEKERNLDSRVKDLDKKEGNLNDKDKEQQEKANQQKLTGEQQKKKDEDQKKIGENLSKLKGELDETGKQQKEKEANLNDKDKEQKEKEATLNDKDKEQKAKEASLNDKDKEQKAKEASLNDKDKEQKAKEASLNDKDKEQKEKEATLNDKDKEQKAKEATLNDKDKEQKAKEAALNDKDKQQQEKDNQQKLTGEQQKKKDEDQKKTSENLSKLQGRLDETGKQQQQEANQQKLTGEQQKKKDEEQKKTSENLSKLQGQLDKTGKQQQQEANQQKLTGEQQKKKDEEQKKTSENLSKLQGQLDETGKQQQQEANLQKLTGEQQKKKDEEQKKTSENLSKLQGQLDETGKQQQQEANQQKLTGEQQKKKDEEQKKTSENLSKLQGQLDETGKQQQEKEATLNDKDKEQQEKANQQKLTGEQQKKKDEDQKKIGENLSKLKGELDETGKQQKEKEANLNDKDKQQKQKDTDQVKREEKLKDQEKAIDERAQSKYKDVMNTYFDETFRFANIKKNNNQQTFDKEEIESIVSKFGKLSMGQKEFLVKNIDKVEIQKKHFSEENKDLFLKEAANQGFKGVVGMEAVESKIDPQELKKMIKDRDRASSPPKVKEQDQTQNKKTSVEQANNLRKNLGEQFKHGHHTPNVKPLITKTKETLSI